MTRSIRASRKLPMKSVDIIEDARSISNNPNLYPPYMVISTRSKSDNFNVHYQSSRLGWYFTDLV